MNTGVRAEGHRARPGALIVLSILFALVLAGAIVSTTIGAAGIPLQRMFAALGFGTGDASMISRDWLVLSAIRLPRIVLAMMVGAMLASAGTIMQGVFRNPLADPALVGVSSGAALAAAVTIVAGDKFMAATVASVPFEILPLAAFLGALATTSALYRIATHQGRTSIAIFLLGGLAIAALANAATGVLVFLADDRQLRDITFWMLGSLGGATWAKVLAVLPFLALMLLALPWIARGLDLLVLGEAEAFHMGVAVERLKTLCVILIALAIGAAVCVSGIVGFVGIVVPHLLRLVIGPGHRLLLPASAMLGALILLCADTAARMVAAPAELPIGIVTAAIGAPFFIFLLMRQRALVSM
jgi:iron complex transport system permease protein